MFRFRPRHSRITAGLCALGLVAFAVTGCTEPVAQSAPVAAQKTTSRCRTVPKDVVAQIASFINPETGASLRGARAVHTEDGIPGGTWYVAADLEGPGLGGDDEIIVVPMAQLAAGTGHLFAYWRLRERVHGPAQRRRQHVWLCHHRRRRQGGAVLRQSRAHQVGSSPYSSSKRPKAASSER